MEGEQIFAIDQDLTFNQIQPLQFISRAHSNSIQSLAVHPDHSSFLTGSHDRTIKLWDVNKFKETRTIQEHKEGVWSLDYTKDGSMFVSGSPDASVVVWDSKQNSASFRLKAHSGKVYSTRFNETSALLGTCGEHGQIFVWDLKQTKQPLNKIKINTLVVYDFQWSKNQSMFFVSTLGSMLLGFDTKTGNQICQDIVTPNDHQSKCQSVAANFNFANNRIYCGTSRGTVAWYELQGGKLNKKTELVAHMDSVRTINYHPSKKILMTTGRDGSVKMWNAQSNQHHPRILGNLVAHRQNVPGAAFLGEKQVVCGSWDQSLALWSIQSLIK